MKISMEDSQKTQVSIVIWPSCITLGHIPKGFYTFKYRQWKRYLQSYLQWQKLGSGIKFMNLCKYGKNAVLVHNEVLEPQRQMKLLFEGQYMELSITLNEVAHIWISKMVQYLSDADLSFESWIYVFMLRWVPRPWWRYHSRYYRIVGNVHRELNRNRFTTEGVIIHTHIQIHTFKHTYTYIHTETNKWKNPTYSIILCLLGECTIS